MIRLILFLYLNILSTHSYAVVQDVKRFALVIRGLFGIYQYLEHKSAVRVDRSMAFVERYHEWNHYAGRCVFKNQ